jgi:hypothetical protein
LIDLGADHLRQHRASTFRTDGNGNRRAVDQRRRQEIAEFRLIDRIGRDFLLSRNCYDDAILSRITGCSKDQRRAQNLGCRERLAHHFDGIRRQKRRKIRLRFIGMSDDPGLGVHKQPDLGESLVAIAENRYAFLRNAEEGRKDGQLLGHDLGI